MSEQPESIKSQQPKKIRLANVGILLSTLAIVTFMVCFGYGYYQVSKVNIMLAKAVDYLQTQAEFNHQQIEGFKASIQQLSQSSHQTDTLFVQHEKMLSDWRTLQQGDLSKWYVAEAQYLVRLANDQMQFAKNTQLAITLLQHADKALAKVVDKKVTPLREALTRDIERLRALSPIDVNQLYLELSAIESNMDDLPLPVTPLKVEQVPMTINNDLSWWRRSLQTLWQTLQKIIVVHYDGGQALPLILPEEKPFLYQNLHSNMQTLKWALLNYDGIIFQASLSQTIHWVKRYFDVNDPKTTIVLNRLTTLQAVKLELPIKNISSTVDLFNGYMSASSHTA